MRISTLFGEYGYFLELHIYKPKQYIHVSLYTLQAKNKLVVHTQKKKQCTQGSFYKVMSFYKCSQKSLQSKVDKVFQGSLHMRLVSQVLAKVSPVRVLKFLMNSKQNLLCQTSLPFYWLICSGLQRLLTFCKHGKINGH